MEYSHYLDTKERRAHIPAITYTTEVGAQSQNCIRVKFILLGTNLEATDKLSVTIKCKRT